MERLIAATCSAEKCPKCGQPTRVNEVQVLADQLPARGYVRQKLLMKLLPFSPATLWRKVASGDFPKPHKLSENVTAWRVEDVKAWLVAKGLIDRVLPLTHDRQ